MANLKFYKGASAPTSAQEGAIFFNTSLRTINVKVGNDWQAYSGLQNAEYKDGYLTLTKADGSKIELNFTDVASRQMLEQHLTAYATFKSNTETALKNLTDASDALQSNKLDASAQVVKSVDTTASNGVNLSLGTDGKLDVTVSAGSVANNNASVVTGGAVYTAIEAAKTAAASDAATKVAAEAEIARAAEKANADAITGLTNNKLETVSDTATYVEVSKDGTAIVVADSALQTKIGELESAINTAAQSGITSIDGYTGSVVFGFDPNGGHLGDVTFGITGSGDLYGYVDLGTAATKDESYFDKAGDAAKAQAAAEKVATDFNTAMDARVDAIETLLAEDADDVINNVKDVINYFNGVKEDETGAALLNTVAGHTTSIQNLENTKIGTVTDSADYLEISTNGTTVTIADAALKTKIGELEESIQAANEAGVLTIDGKAGDFSVINGGTANGSINITVSNSNEIGASIVGLKSAAFTESSAYATAAQGALADSALQKADITTGSANGTISVEGSDVAVKGLGSAAYTASTAYATSVQGAKADSAIQSVSNNQDNDYIEAATTGQEVVVSAKVSLMANVEAEAYGAGQFLADAWDVKKHIDSVIASEMSWVEFN